jgi:hypothetical protein
MPLSLFWIVLPALAEDSPGRFEIGAAFSSVHTGVTARPLSGSLGPGLEADLNIGRHLALDAAVDVLPSTNRFQGQSVIGLFGAKAGIRGRRFGFFAKVRPGFITVDNALRQITLMQVSRLSIAFALRFDRLTEPILDFGGVAEYYPAHHWTLRYDLGDTVMFEDPLIVIGIRSIGVTSVTNHLQFSTSVHYRF